MSRHYPPIEDHGLIGDGTTAALVARDGAVVWLCAPRFDSPPLFCELLDAARGGAFRVAPDILVGSTQRYERDTGVLVTEMRSPTGLVRVTDALTLRAGAELDEDATAGRGELIRVVEVLEGRVKVRIDITPRGCADSRPGREGLRLACPERPDLEVHLWSSVPLESAQTQRDLAAGERVYLVLRWTGGHLRAIQRATARPALECTRPDESW